MASSRMLALLGLLAVAGYQNRDKLGSILGRFAGTPDNSGNSAGVSKRNANGSVGTANDGFGGILDSLGGLFRGGTTVAGLGSGGLSGALTDLVNHFSANGHGDTARSWVETGPNREVAPTQLETALGEDSIRQLTQQTGLSRQELLDRLSNVLPTAVDKLTPEGRLPTKDEEPRLVAGI
jgi:uncharacterized protein YidB (DUF937 family)